MALLVANGGLSMSRSLPLFWLVLAVGAPAYGQFQNGSQSVLLNLPETSQRAVITQRVGITDITIT